MSPRRLRSGELLALAGAVCVIVALTLRWYEAPGGRLDAWDTFGVAVVLLIARGRQRARADGRDRHRAHTALPVAAAVWCVLLGLAGVIAAIVRVLERPEHAIGLCAGTWLALAGAVMILVGSWQSMRDERTSRYKPAMPEPRQPPE